MCMLCALQADMYKDRIYANTIHINTTQVSAHACCAWGATCMRCV